MISFHPISYTTPFSKQKPQLTAPKTLTFEGATHLQHRRWLSPEAFQTLVNLSKSPYVGQIPTPLLNKVEYTPQSIYQAFDEVTPLLRQLQDKGLSFEFKLGNSKTVQLSYQAVGGFGAVYCLTLGDSPTFCRALKVYKKMAIDPLYVHHGTYAEPGNGLLLQTDRYRNLSAFDFANPKAGWGVFEFITNSMSSNRRNGKRVETKMALFDHQGENNQKNGIFYDYGGMFPGKNIQTFEDFKQAMNSSNLKERISATYQIRRLGDLDEREAACRMAMATGQEAVQFVAAHDLWRYSSSFATEMFFIAMEIPNESVQAAASLCIGKIESDSTETAYRMIMETGKKLPQATAAYCIYKLLPINFRKTACLLAMGTGNDLAQAKAAENMSYTNSESLMQQVYQMAMETGKPLVQAAASTQIGDFESDDFKKMSYQQSMETGNEDVQVAATSQIKWLPGDFQEDALAMANATNFPTVKLSAAVNFQQLINRTRIQKVLDEDFNPHFKVIQDLKVL